MEGYIIGAILILFGIGYLIGLFLSTVGVYFFIAGIAIALFVIIKFILNRINKEEYWWIPFLSLAVLSAITMVIYSYHETVTEFFNNNWIYFAVAAGTVLFLAVIVAAIVIIRSYIKNKAYRETYSMKDYLDPKRQTRVLKEPESLIEDSDNHSIEQQNNYQADQMREKNEAMKTNIDSKRLYLEVPYEEKDEAKAKGARWDPIQKKWYEGNPKFYFRVEQWIPGNIVLTNQIYIVEGYRACWKCGKKTRVVAIGIDEYYVIEPPIELTQNEDIVGDFEALPRVVLDYIMSHYAVKPRYSKKENRTYISNGCDFCDAIQGKWPLFHEPDSPFYPSNVKDASELTWYRIKLKNNIPFYLSSIPAYSSCSNFYKMHSKFVDLDLEI